MAFKMKGSPMQRNFGVGSPAKKSTKNEETGTIYQDGMALKDNKTEHRYSHTDAEAAKELGSGRVNRSHKRHHRKASKMGTAKGLSKEARGRRNVRKSNRSKAAKTRAEELTAKRFAKTEGIGQDRYNLIIERHNKKRKESKAELGLES